MEFIIGILSGIATALGVGGGTILIIFLTFILNLDIKTSLAINLVCYIPASIISIIYNFKRKNINLKKILPIVFFGILGSVLGTIISKKIETILLKKAFGIILILIAFYEIYNLIKIEKENKT